MSLVVMTFIKQDHIRIIKKNKSMFILYHDLFHKTTQKINENVIMITISLTSFHPGYKSHTHMYISGLSKKSLTK